MTGFGFLAKNMSKKESGVLNFLTYKDKETGKYCGICVQLGLYSEGDNLDVVRANLAEAARGYVKTVMKDNLSEELLDVQPTIETMSIYKEAIKAPRPMDSDRPNGAVYSDELEVFSTPARPLSVA